VVSTHVLNQVFDSPTVTAGRQSQLGVAEVRDIAAQAVEGRRVESVDVVAINHCCGLSVVPALSVCETLTRQR
jgi:hypothetical protein